MPAGAALLVAGANGSGKTTFLRLVAGLHKPTGGSLEVFGLDTVRERLQCRRWVTLISHASCLYDGLTPRETLRVWSDLGGRRGGALAEGELDRLLEEADLGHRGDALVGGFSAGMRKRLSLLRLQIERPRLLLLDEPFSALDVEGRRLVERWIRRFRERGGTIVIASHDLERTVPLCERAILLQRGQVGWAGSAEAVIERREGVS